MSHTRENFGAVRTGSMKPGDYLAYETASLIVKLVSLLIGVGRRIARGPGSGWARQTITRHPQSGNQPMAR